MCSRHPPRPTEVGSPQPVEVGHLKNRRVGSESGRPPAQCLSRGGDANWVDTDAGPEPARSRAGTDGTHIAPGKQSGWRGVGAGLPASIHVAQLEPTEVPPAELSISTSTFIRQPRSPAGPRAA